MKLAATPLQDLQSRRLLAEHKRVREMFDAAQKRWLRARAPSLALRQMNSVANLLTRQARK